MAHHGSKPMSDEARNILRNLVASVPTAQMRVMDDLNDAIRREELKLGATGKFPEGKIDKHDEGEIRVAIGQKDGKVVIDFGTPVVWVGFTAEQADDIANTLHEHATEARLRRGTQEGR